MKQSTRIIFSNILTKLKIRHFVWFSEPSNPSLQFVNALDVIFKYIKRGFGCIDGMTAKFHLSKICVSKFAHDARFGFCFLKKPLKTLGRPCPVNFHLLKNPQWIWTAAPVQFFFLAYKNCSIHNFRNSL